MDRLARNLDDLRRKITSRTKLVAVGYASNAVGTINPVEQIVKLAHAAGALVFLDAVHYAPHGPIDVRALDCDFLACSPYKFFGPHMGCIFGKREHLRRFHPYKVRPATDAPPDSWETGTQVHEGLAGVGAAVDYLAELGRRCGPAVTGRREALLSAYRAIHEHEMALAVRMIRGLLAIPGLRFFGISDPARFAERVPTVAVRLVDPFCRLITAPDALAAGVTVPDTEYVAPVVAGGNTSTTLNDTTRTWGTNEWSTSGDGFVDVAGLKWVG